jgi:putative methyltransferase
MKTIGFVQVNFPQGPRELNAHFLPYSAGIVLAYALQNNPDWQVNDIVWRRDPIELTAQALCRNHLVALSTYVWNREYNYALARRIKELNPACLIVAGGPEPAITDVEIFTKHPYLDVLVKLEGEKIFSNLLAHYGCDLSAVAGLILNVAGQAVDTGEAERISDLEQLPSPYLTGLFDNLIRDYPDVVWNGTLETNRGCPYQCTFCDWGSLTYSKIKKFDLDRVFAELEWMGQHCGFVTITDANFGMFVERDNAVITKLIEVQHRWGRIKNFSLTWAKNQKNEVVEIMRRLANESPTASSGLTVSVQSMDDHVLDIIKRKNLDQHKITEIFSLCNRYNIPVYTELILGLPGETPTSWRENFWQLFRAGNHSGVVVLHAQLLENAEMNLSQRRFYKLDAVPIYDYMSGTYDNGEVIESIDVVVGTRDIPRDTMLDIMTWNAFIQAFHVNGMTSYVARFMACQGMDYAEFYDQLWQQVQTDPWWHSRLQETRDLYQQWITDGRIDTWVGGIPVPGWNLHNRLTLMVHSDAYIDQTYQLVHDFLQSHVPIYADQLTQFQRASMMEHHKLPHLPEQHRFDWDFWGYVTEGADLDQPVLYEFSTSEDPAMSKSMFLENFWFGRKRNFQILRIKKVNTVHDIT